jgi:hypothetical protein
MGIDVYLAWDNQTDEDQKAQYVGFDVRSGDVGYLREAYHGGPYGTHLLIQEDWEVEGGVEVENSVLQSRMSMVAKAVIWRNYKLYYSNGDKPHGVIEIEKESSQSLLDGLSTIFSDMEQFKSPPEIEDIPLSDDEAFKLMRENVDIAWSVKSFYDFVILHGVKEKAGLNPKIIVSY